ncbi:MAG: L,D-transpeptidase family protein [Xanthomonadales bacterium]|jgi:L,D-transpeptidase ErfK/SrfK|nr:L,D-transpeptidase family protein [Xanthomonadales bacterium]
MTISRFAPAILICLGWLASAQAQHFSLPPGSGDLFGQEEYLVGTNVDTLADVARQFGVGHQEIRLANPDVDFWLLPADARVLLPKRHILPHARREGIVLNVPEMRLYYFPRACKDDEACSVVTYPVSIGQMDWLTPLGTTRVTAKVPNPTWTPPESIRREAEADGKTLPAVVPPGPDNPLGAYALYLDLPGYRIHGTNRPYGVGMRVTHGCVRMYPEDIESLFEQVSVGTKVQIVDQPIKLGWSGPTLYMEVHPPLEEDIEGIAMLKDTALRRLEEMEAERPFILNGREFLRALDEQRGIPVAISRGNLGQ